MWLLLSFFLSSLFPSLSPFFRPVQVAEMMLDNMANVTPVMDLLITLQVAKDARQGAVPPAGTKRSRRHFVTLRTLMGGGATTLPYRGFAVPPSVPLLGSVSSYSLTVRRCTYTDTHVGSWCAKSKAVPGVRAASFGMSSVVSKVVNSCSNSSSIGEAGAISDAFIIAAF